MMSPLVVPTVIDSAVIPMVAVAMMMIPVMMVVIVMLVVAPREIPAAFSSFCLGRNRGDSGYQCEENGKTAFHRYKSDVL